MGAAQAGGAAEGGAQPGVGGREPVVPVVPSSSRAGEAAHEQLAPAEEAVQEGSEALEPGRAGRGRAPQQGPGGHLQ